MIKKVGFTKSTALDIVRNTPLLLTGAICRLLATHFSYANNIDTPLLQQFVYNDDQTKTKILIQPDYKWDTSIVQARPALIVRRGDLGTQRIAIADGFGESIQNGIPKNKFLQGSHTIFCVGHDGGSAELLGEEVFPLLLEFAPVIQEDFNLLNLTVTSLASIKKIPEFDDNFASAVTITWIRQNTWALRHDGPWLQEIATQKEILNKGL